MLVKRNFLILIAALCLIMSARSAQAAQLFTVSRLASGPNWPFAWLGPTPQAVLFGNLPAGGAQGEIGIAQAVLNLGDLVPLPTYADGTTATESEIFWTVHLSHASWDPLITFLPKNYTEGDGCGVEFTGRTYSSGYAITDNQTQYGAERGAPARNVKVLVTVVALRNLPPTPTTKKSWGRLKAGYR